MNQLSHRPQMNLVSSSIKLQTYQTTDTNFNCVTQEEEFLSPSMHKIHFHRNKKLYTDRQQKKKKKKTT